MKIKVCKLHPEAKTPNKATSGSAGFDFYSLEDKVIYPLSSCIFSTGLSFEIPEDYFMSILGRSGLAFKEEIVACHTGTIDSDYRGEVRIKLWNMSTEIKRISKGERIAQAIILPVPAVEFVETEMLNKTDRGAGGFGSTGR